MKRLELGVDLLSLVCIDAGGFMVGILRQLIILATLVAATRRQLAHVIIHLTLPLELQDLLPGGCCQPLKLRQDGLIA